MAERIGLRARIFLFFALIAVGALAALAAAGFVAARHAPPESVPDLVLAFGVAAFPIVGLCAFVWLKFDEHVARPVLTLGGEIRAALHAGATVPSDRPTGRYLGLLAPAAREVIAALADQRSRTDAAVAAAVADAARQRSRLEAVLRDVEAGVVICGLDHRIRLYNRHALALLHVCGDLGLGRLLTQLVAAQPIRHTLHRLVRRFEDGRHHDHPDGLTALVIATTATGNRQLRGRMVLTLDPETGGPAGYIISFDDITGELAAGIWRDRLLTEVSADMRRRVAELAVVAEVLLARLPSGDDQELLADAVARAPAALGERLDQLDAAAGDILASAWPMANVLSTTLLAMIRDRRSEGRDIAFEIDAASLWLHCDAATVIDLIDRLANRIAVFASVETMKLTATRSDALAWLELGWSGPAVSPRELSSWLDEPLDPSLGPLTGRDVLNRHGTDVWCERTGAVAAKLRLPLTVVEAGHGRPPVRLPERPEFYDFDLAATVDRAGLADLPLRSLAMVVFDTETTGLEPSRGDEIVQIAGVRVVNGRLLTGEVFDSYVDPRRPIPAASSRVHGITDDMVRGADPVEAVLARFHGFVGDAVLVAHNAAFDMKFLARGAPRAGVAFEGPVLDTVLLAAHVFGADAPLTLDALATRFGIEIADQDRHTALGDSLATARVLVRLIDALDGAGVRTLGEALAASDRQVAIRRAQRAY